MEEPFKRPCIVLNEDLFLNLFTLIAYTPANQRALLVSIQAADILTDRRTAVCSAMQQLNAVKKIYVINELNNCIHKSQACLTSNIEHELSGRFTSSFQHSVLSDTLYKSRITTQPRLTSESKPFSVKPCCNYSAVSAPARYLLLELIFNVARSLR